MFGKLFKSRKQMIMCALLIVLAFLVFQKCGGRKLFYSGSPIDIKEKSTKKLSELEAKEECVGESYYTQFGPRAVCHGQATINDHMNWELVSGIGSD